MQCIVFAQYNYTDTHTWFILFMIHMGTNIVLCNGQAKFISIREQSLFTTTRGEVEFPISGALKSCFLPCIGMLETCTL